MPVFPGGCRDGRLPVIGGSASSWLFPYQREQAEGQTSHQSFDKKIVTSWGLGICAMNHHAAPAKSLQSRRTLCNPKDCSPLGSSVHGILQARILEWIFISSFRGSSWPRDWVSFVYLHLQTGSLSLAPLFSNFYLGKFGKYCLTI